MPMGVRGTGAFLYGAFLRHNPKNSKWANRDRLSVGGTRLVVALFLLHLAGFKLTMKEIKRFRQLRSHTPGHPDMV